MFEELQIEEGEKENGDIREMRNLNVARKVCERLKTIGNG